VDALFDLGRPVLVGPSRKSFIGALLDLPPDQRVEGTLGAISWLAARGVHVVRVHDVREAVRALRVVDAIARAGG
jgi:dihydropteroate synthase